MTKRTTHSVAPAVMDQISRTYFLLLTSSSLIATMLTALLLSYLISIVFYWVRIETADTMAWGARANLSEIIGHFPWWALLLLVPLFALTVWLVKQQGRLYRYRTRTLVITITLASLLLGIGMSMLTFGGTHPSRQLRSTDSEFRRGPGWQRNVER